MLKIIYLLRKDMLGFLFILFKINVIIYLPTSFKIEGFLLAYKVRLTYNSINIY
jgi:hypothetical protein